METPYNQNIQSRLGFTCFPPADHPSGHRYGHESSLVTFGIETSLLRSMSCLDQATHAQIIVTTNQKMANWSTSDHLYLPNLRHPSGQILSKHLLNLLSALHWPLLLEYLDQSPPTVHTACLRQSLHLPNLEKENGNMGDHAI